MMLRRSVPNLVVLLSPFIILVAFSLFPWYHSDSGVRSGFELLNSNVGSRAFYVTGAWLLPISGILGLATALWLTLSKDTALPRAVCFNVGVIGLTTFLLFFLQLASSSVPSSELSRMGIGGIITFVVVFAMILQAFLPDLYFREMPRSLTMWLSSLTSPKSPEPDIYNGFRYDRRYSGILLFIAGALSLIAYNLLPWLGMQGLVISASDLNSSFSLISLASSFNPLASAGGLAIQVNLVMIGGLLALVAGIAGLFRTNVFSRAIGVAAGIMCLAHFGDFIGKVGFDVVGQVAQFGFWLAFVAAIAMLIQGFLPSRR